MSSIEIAVTHIMEVLPAVHCFSDRNVLFAERFEPLRTTRLVPPGPASFVTVMA